MKNRIKKLIAIGILLIPLLSNEILVYAEDDPIQTELVEPTKPKPISGKKTNAKIKKYNEAVTKYNTEVDEYNKKVDELYEKEKAEVTSYNESVDSHNAAEDTKVAEVAARNAEKQAEYDALYEQYQKDLATEEKIKSYGYESTEQYNNTVAPYNEAAAAAAERNANAGSFDIDSAYTIERGDPPASDDSSSNDTSEEDDEEQYDVNVYLTYNFDDFSYSTTFTIGQYDTITFYAAGAQLDPEEPGSSILHMTTDNDHLKGSWYPGGSELQSNSVINEDGWNCGDSHTVSYREGKNHYSDDPTLYMTYDYYWVPKPTYPIYNVPIKPNLDLEEYTPDYWEKKTDPVKKDYLEHLKLMDLIKEDKPNEEPHKEEIKLDEPLPQTVIPAQALIPEIQFKIPKKTRMAETGDDYIRQNIERWSLIIGCFALLILMIVFNKKE